MVKKLTFLTLLLAIAAFAVVPAMAQSTTATPDVTASASAQATTQANATAAAPLTASTGTFVTTRFLVNVRSGPGLQYTIIGKLRSGDAVDVTGMFDPANPNATGTGTNNANNSTGSNNGSTTGNNNSGTGSNNGSTSGSTTGSTTGSTGNSTTSNPNRAVWLRINFNGQEGWVSSSVVTFTGDMTTVQFVQPGATAVLRNGQNNGQNGNNQSLSDVVVVTRFNTNLRQSFSTSSQLLATIPFSTTLTILGRSQDNRWLRVSYNNQTGWVSSGLVAFNRGSINSLPIFDEAGNQIGVQNNSQNQASSTAQATAQATAAATTGP
jgi:uncharacterized protein YgiM (DUF1202 family)